MNAHVSFPPAICLHGCLVMQDYRPGTSRADLQDAQKRQKSRVSLGGRDLQEQQPTREAQSDGSYRGRST